MRGACDMAKAQKIVRAIFVLGVTAAVSSCATSAQGPIQQSLRINGDIQPNQVKISSFGNHQGIGIMAFSSNYRQFSRKIKKGGKSEEVLYWEPIRWREHNELAEDTRKLKVSLIIENPLFKAYRLVKITDEEGASRKEEILKFKNGKEESFADIQEFYDIELPVTAGKRVKFSIRLDLLEDLGPVGGKSLTVSELSFSSRSHKEINPGRGDRGGDYPETSKAEQLVRD